MRSIQILVLSAVAGIGCVGEVSAQKVNFRRHVLPILETSCFRCHKEAYKDKRGRTKKPKGGLRLDGRGWILKGGKNGASVVPGKPSASSLYGRISLDPDDDDIMPAKGDVLSKSKIALIEKWIAQGADFGSWVGKTGPAAAEIEKAQAASNLTKLSTPTLSLYEDMGKGMKSALPQAIRRAAGRKCQVVPVVPGSALLRVAYVSNESSVEDEDLAHLVPLASHITRLGLAKTRITDHALDSVGRMKRLTHLDLNRTAVTDAGLVKLTSLAELRSLNLHSTGITDDGVQVLGQLPKLEKLYLWNTKVTREGVKRIRRLLPRTKISYELVLPKPDPSAGSNSRRRRR
jgi:Planctomycete cytochrome C/Leucine Rich repeat